MAVGFPETESGPKILEKILSVSALDYPQPQAWTNCVPYADWTRLEACTFCYVKKKRQLDLQISSQVNKTLKILH